MWFGIRISSPFHLATQIISLQNLKCAKNAKNACAVFPALQSEPRAVTILHIGDQKYSCTISVLKMFSVLGQMCSWITFINWKQNITFFVEKQVRKLLEILVFALQNFWLKIISSLRCLRFLALYILKGYNLSGQMKRARNSDSKTHVKK